MRRLAVGFVVMFGSVSGVATVLLAACSGGSGSNFNAAGNAGGSTTVTLADGAVVTVSNGDSGPNPILTGGNSDGGSGGTVVQGDGGCAGLQCQIASTCTADGGTTITGKIMDPAGTNPLYNVLAYVPMYDPAVPASIPSGQGIQPIAGGVTFPAGVTCDSCSYLYTGNPIAIGTSGTDGTFTIANAPSGKNIPVVVQVGKWRTHVTVPTVTDCQAADAGEIKLPSSADGTDPIVSMPQVAISMGGSDTVECLPYRMGISPSEFVMGAGTAKQHFLLFAGGAKGSSSSSQTLWKTASQLEAYDVALFSCEGKETTAADPAVLEEYVNNGGRAFLSHFHYAWLAGPLNGQAKGQYTANADWGTNLATWNSGDEAADYGNTVGGEIVTTLNGGGGTFAKGVALQQWLGNVGALGSSTSSQLPKTEVPIETPAYDPDVKSTNSISQPWVTWDYNATGDAKTYPTGYFSFNTPVGAMAPPDGGSAPYCGRVVFSGLHVGGAKMDTGGMQMPSSNSCDAPPLSPQEKVLEFMIFDLSSCVSPDTSSPPPPVVIPPAPPK